MFTKLRSVLATGLAVLVVSQVSAFAEPFSYSRAAWDQTGHKLRLPVVKKIDKSCLMVCERWGDDGCLKWVTKCKGNSANPKLQGSPRARE